MNGIFPISWIFLMHFIYWPFDNGNPLRKLVDILRRNDAIEKVCCYTIFDIQFLICIEFWQIWGENSIYVIISSRMCQSLHELNTQTRKIVNEHEICTSLLNTVGWLKMATHWSQIVIFEIEPKWVHMHFYYIFAVFWTLEL